MCGDSCFDIDGCKEGENAEGEKGGYVKCLPARGSVGGFRDGEDGQGKACYYGDGARVVHPDIIIRPYGFQ